MYVDEDEMLYWYIQFNALHKRAWWNGFAMDDLELDPSQQGMVTNNRVEYMKEVRVGLR